jgi:histidine triad (HIT) family protein
MFNHEPPNYDCPFCAIVNGGGDGHNRQDDIVYSNDHVTAFIAAKWWVNNPGHVLVVPNKHFENIYDTPDDYLAEVYKAVKKLSIAIREAYGADATSNRQHNEPDGNQAIWHLHAHVFPRYKDDRLYENHGNKQFTTPEERAPYAKKLRAYFAGNP